jgi:hypothetical protein
MENLRKRLVDDLVLAVSEVLTQRVDADALEQVAEAMYGPPRPLDPENPLATRESPAGVASIVRAVGDAIRERLAAADGDG